MGVVEFELVREVHAAVDAVFARLSDIEGHDAWMPRKGSIRRRSRLTSTGPVGVGTTYVDETVVGTAPGEIAVYDPPRELVYHWWQKSGKGATQLEGWPAYRLEVTGPATTRVRHHVRLQTHGPYRLVTPLVARMARRERTTTVDALVASFEASGGLTPAPEG